MIVSKMRVKSRLTDMSEWVSIIRGACDALFVYELKGSDMFFLVGVTTPHGHPKPCPPDTGRPRMEKSHSDRPRTAGM